MAFPVYKPAQPMAIRQLNRQYEMEHRNNSKRRRFRLQFNQKFKESAENLAIDFGRKSTIHGMSRLFQEKSNKYERCFWLFTLICALLGSIYVCLILSRRFNAGSLQTVVDSTNKPVFRIPFPEVAICNANHLNWERLEEAKHHFMPYENDTERLRMFELVIGLYDNMAFGDFKGFAALEGQPIELVSNINFSLVYDYMTWHCDELLINCFWRHYKMNCCEIFLKTKGQGGICWHFNTLSNEAGRNKQMLDDKYPWRVGSAGPTSALSVRVMLNEQKHFRHDNEKGVWVSIMEPTVWNKDPYWVPANTETMVEIEPVIYTYDNETRSLPSQQRQCLFNNERNSNDFKSLNGFDYMIENCLSQCHQEYLLRHCNCTVDFLFPPAGYKACQIKDFLCLARYSDNFRFTHQPGAEDYLRNNFKGMVCNCFRNCYSLNYVTDVRPSFLPRYIRENQTYVDLDVHFRFETMMVYRTSLVFGWVDLMVAFGGIAGLFLGCSLISAMELLYFAFIELPVFVLKEFKNNDKLENASKPSTEQSNNRRPIRRRHWGLNNRIMASQQQFQNHDFPAYKNQFNHSNAKNEALQLWSQQYFLTNKNNF